MLLGGSEGSEAPGDAWSETESRLHRDIPVYFYLKFMAFSPLHLDRNELSGKTKKKKKQLEEDSHTRYSTVEALGPGGLKTLQGFGPRCSCVFFQ